MSEFNLIEKYFKPLTQGRAEAASLQNDTALLFCEDNHDLVVSTDTLNEEIHFFTNTSPEIIAQKALRSNLSDILSSGAKPYCYQLAIAFPQGQAVDEAWLQSFSSALLTDQKSAGVFCSGGDTTTIKAGLSISITMFGKTPKGNSVGRSGAKSGDVIILTDAVGAGIVAYQNSETVAPPLHNNKLAEIIRCYAHAAVDISDGLLADIGHVAHRSALTAQLDFSKIPVLGDDEWAAMCGGDDYQIVMAVPAHQADECMQALQGAGAKPALIGRFVSGAPEVSVVDDLGQSLSLPKKTGWQHF